MYYSTDAFRTDCLHPLLMFTETLEFCKASGDLFQGRFFLKPTSRSRNVPLSRTAVVQLVAALQEPDIRLRDVETLIARDVSLAAFVSIRNQ